MAARPARNPAHLALLFDRLPDALLVVDASGSVVDANPAARDAFGSASSPGRGPSGLVGRRLADLVPGLDLRRPPAAGPERVTARTLDGTSVPVEVSRATVPWGSGADHLLLVLGPDTAGELASRPDTAPEPEAPPADRRIQAILRAAEEAVCGVDSAGRVVLANPSAARLLGTSVADIAGSDLHALAMHTRADGSPYPPEESPVAETLATGRRHHGRREVAWRRDGRAVPVELGTAAIREGDRIVGAIVTLTDLSRRLDAERRHARLLDVLGGEIRAGLAALESAVPGAAAASVRHLLAVVDAAVGRDPGWEPFPSPAPSPSTDAAVPPPRDESGGGPGGGPPPSRAAGPATSPAPAARPSGGGGATSTAELPLLTILPGTAQPPAARVPELLVWPAPHEATTRALTRRGWSPVPVPAPQDLAASVRPQTAALLIDPTGPVTRRALVAVRAAAASAALPVLVVAGVGEVEAVAGSDRAGLAPLLAALRTGRHEAVRVIVIDGDPAVSAALALGLARAGMQPTQARHEGEAMLRAAISPPDLVLLGLSVEQGGRPGIVDWLRNAERLVATPVVAYTTETLGLGHQGRLQGGHTVLALQSRAEGDAVEARIVDLVLRLAGPR